MPAQDNLCRGLAVPARQRGNHRVSEDVPLASGLHASHDERLDTGAASHATGRTPLNLERNVSLAAVRAFKLVTLTEVDAIVAVVRRLLPGLTERDGVDLIAAATAMAGAFWQMATPGPEAAALYRSDPRLAHAVVDVEPRVARLLTAMLAGMRP